ncbi:hypothetical protein [Stakelama saccharophila]|uniref:Secreted protein n=1 Tax=Stakelama saccharophila TaxID=3075605 RepID=A0ABZ0B751_9SPHN|nr:hypothetical protein [Stakelama sp. W311]WNO53257.1 hypothetical protein RPR59_12510 [Stakelama sp. W311]
MTGKSLKPCLYLVVALLVAMIGKARPDVDRSAQRPPTAERHFEFEFSLLGARAHFATSVVPTASD